MMENIVYTYGQTHELKTWPSYFNAVLNGTKTFEVRKADRNFKVGDVLLLREWRPKGFNSVAPNEREGEYTGAVCTRQITYILAGGQFGILSGYCVLGLKEW